MCGPVSDQATHEKSEPRRIHQIPCDSLCTSQASRYQIYIQSSPRARVHVTQIVMPSTFPNIWCCVCASTTVFYKPVKARPKKVTPEKKKKKNVEQKNDKLSRQDNAHLPTSLANNLLLFVGRKIRTPITRGLFTAGGDQMTAAAGVAAATAAVSRSPLPLASSAASSEGHAHDRARQPGLAAASGERRRSSPNTSEGHHPDKPRSSLQGYAPTSHARPCPPRLEENADRCGNGAASAIVKQASALDNDVGPL